MRFETVHTGDSAFHCNCAENVLNEAAKEIAALDRICQSNSAFVRSVNEKLRNAECNEQRIADLERQAKAELPDRILQHKFDASCPCELCRCRQTIAVLEIGLASQTQICNDLRSRNTTLERQLAEIWGTLCPDCGPEEYKKFPQEIAALQRQLADLRREYDEEAISHDIEEKGFKEKLTAKDEEIARLQHESKVFQSFRRDVSDGMECLPKCDSYGHEDECPLANPVVAFRKLREEIVRLTKLFIEYVPDAAHYNSLPRGGLRQYIHDLETNADPAGTVAEAICQRENANALAVKTNELKQEIASLRKALEAHRRFHDKGCPNLPECYVCQAEQALKTSEKG